MKFVLSLYFNLSITIMGENSWCALTNQDGQRILAIIRKHFQETAKDFDVKDYRNIRQIRQSPLYKKLAQQVVESKRRIYTYCLAHSGYTHSYLPGRNSMVGYQQLVKNKPLRLTGRNGLLISPVPLKLPPVSEIPLRGDIPNLVTEKLSRMIPSGISVSSFAFYQGIQASMAANPLVWSGSILIGIGSLGYFFYQRQKKIENEKEKDLLEKLLIGRNSLALEEEKEENNLWMVRRKTKQPFWKIFQQNLFADEKKVQVETSEKKRETTQKQVSIRQKKVYSQKGEK